MDGSHRRRGSRFFLYFFSSCLVKRKKKKGKKEEERTIDGIDNMFPFAYVALKNNDTCVLMKRRTMSPSQTGSDIIFERADKRTFQHAGINNYRLSGKIIAT